jgi:toxin CcdB
VVIRRFDVFRNDSAQTQKRFPYFLVLQSDLLSGLSTVAVAPIGKAKIVEGRMAETLMPTLMIEDQSMVLFTPELAAVPARILRKQVANLEAQREVVTRALDMLFSGI